MEDGKRWAEIVERNISGIQNLNVADGEEKVGRFTWAGPVVGGFSKATHLSLRPLPSTKWADPLSAAPSGRPHWPEPKSLSQTMIPQPVTPKSLCQTIVGGPKWRCPQGAPPTNSHPKVGTPTTKKAQNGVIVKPCTNFEVATSSRASALIPQAPYLTPTHRQPSYPNPHPPAPYTLCRGGLAA